MKYHRTTKYLVGVSIVLATLIALGSPLLTSGWVKASSERTLERSTQFYTPRPNHGAVEQIAELTAQGRHADADLIRKMISTPTAVWIEKGSPKQAMLQVRQVTYEAAGKNTIPVLVAYNIPFRDCAQYSAGGATSMAEYKAWIDGVAKGIGDRSAVVILEPDGLGIIPWYTNIYENLEWCQPAEADPDNAAAERFEMLNYAVDALKALPNARVYLDGTHSAWLGVADIADRLLQAGVARADGFFLNVSNYRFTEHVEKYGNWISQCLYLEQNVSWYDITWCGSQYYPADPSDFSTWTRTDDQYAQQLADAGITTLPLDSMAHFVIDTSRNGQGHWTPERDYPDPQDWCNPPKRGLGLRPTADTANQLLDAYLWIKVPGESDGQCSRGLGSGTNVVDPEWGQVDPPAGHWFPAQALALARRANPPLE